MDDINVISYINEISVKYNIEQKHMIKNYFNYMIDNMDEIVNEKFLNFVENIIHTPQVKNETYINYFVYQMSTFLAI